jgi:hypothetical protein
MLHNESHNRFQCHLLVITVFVREWFRPAQVIPLGRSSLSHQPGSTWRRCHTFLSPVSQLHRKHKVTFLDTSFTVQEWCHEVRKLSWKLQNTVSSLNICGVQDFSQNAYIFDLLFYLTGIALKVPKSVRYS